ncbi:uncharacterized protein K452DRAFT_350621 [Aplosporella prunicola CBS 121167]|uniref:poly(A)-specific ribonuclease n=1 Tax=Aplosporella prunicola CBS 121167 TaxID=1176127 RepID=A0A6A6BFI9_9PEZI|nr:uncharacterized protein K452DRAFT_350621 [Aplosporella prunicola CBS 121167]KAF2142930.1 hypothetical protein K452DRAFT_350621 [Aplosporella prunicola CBS 121167]
MPPAVTRYPPHNVSNPFQHLNQQHALQQASHLQHANAGLQGQNIGAHPAFGTANPNGNMNLFGPAQSNAAMAGGFGGAGALAGGGTGLASHAAQMGFAHGAALQQQRDHEAASIASGGTKGMGTRIRHVWKNNLAQEMAMLRSLVDKYPYISMDTEFPGVVARPMGDFITKASYHYQTVRCNVDLLKIIQLGITLFSTEGEIPPAQVDSASVTQGRYQNNLIMCPCTWTFNFQFSLEEDMYNEDSIQVLKKAGTDFEKHAEMGIDPLEFGSLLITSGLALSDDVNWISFHSGYDFAYLVKLMWCKQLPNDEEEYRKLVEIFFPRLLDVKFLWRHAQRLQVQNSLSAQAMTILNGVGTKSGLQDLAEELGCQRVGTQHEAGSDAWLTGNVFWQLRAKVFEGHVPDEMNGQMWGLTGVGPPASATAQAAVLAAHGHASNINGAFQAALAFHTGATPSRDGPSTPITNAAGLASGTPGPGGHGLGSMTPGGFGNFQYAK